MTTSRRRILHAGVAVVPSLALGMTPDETTDDCTRPGSGPNAGYFPNFVVQSHRGEKALFYDDLLVGRTVLIHCMSIANHAVYPVVGNLAEVQRHLGDRLGKDVFMHSLSVDPEHDTPQALAEFAARVGAKPGWSFWTGARADMEAIRDRLFVHAGGHTEAHHEGHHGGHGPAKDCSMGLMRYGNESVGLWGSVPAKANPSWIAQRLGWLVPREAPVGPPRRRGPLPLARPQTLALVLALAWSGLAMAAGGSADPEPAPAASSATASKPAKAAGWTYQPCPYPGSPTYPGLPGVCHPYPQPRPAGSTQVTTGCPGDCVTTIATGQGIFPPSNPFDFATFPGTNFLPTIYTNMFDGLGKEMPNTLPSTPTVPYNLHDGTPKVSEINPVSPTDDLQTVLAEVLNDATVLATLPAANTSYDQAERQVMVRGVLAAIDRGIDVLEGNPIPYRFYSGLPLLHYTGPEKLRKVEPIKDEAGNTVGGNVDVHQIFFDERIESDTAFFDVSEVQDVPWTVTYTVDVLSRGRDDFSPFVMYMDNPAASPAGKPAMPHIGMDQTFFNMNEGTRTVFKIKMTPALYYNLVYSWGWRVHPPRAQVIENAGKTINYGGTTPPGCPAEYQGMNLHELEQVVFCPADDQDCTKVRCAPGEPRFTSSGQPTACEQAKLGAIAKIGDLAPAKRMWNALRAARQAAVAGDWLAVVAAIETQAVPGFDDWQHRERLPDGVPLDTTADLTIAYLNNTIYAQFTDGSWGRWDAWEERPKTLKVTAYNGDHFVHSYISVDFGGNRGWENQFKSSVRVAGSGCWFTFGRAHWWMSAGGSNGYLCVPEVAGDTPGKHRFEITFNYDPSRRLRFYQFDPFHHDVAIYSIH